MTHNKFGSVNELISSFDCHDRVSLTNHTAIKLDNINTSKISTRNNASNIEHENIYSSFDNIKKLGAVKNSPFFQQYAMDTKIKGPKFIVKPKSKDSFITDNSNAKSKDFNNFKYTPKQTPDLFDHDAAKSVSKEFEHNENIEMPTLTVTKNPFKLADNQSCTLKYPSKEKSQSIYNCNSVNVKLFLFYTLFFVNIFM